MKRIVAEQERGEDFGMGGGSFAALECAAKTFGGEVVGDAQGVFEFIFRATSNALECGFGKGTGDIFGALAQVAALGEPSVLLLAQPCLDRWVGVILEGEAYGFFGFKGESVRLFDPQKHGAQGTERELSDLVSECFGGDASRDLFKDLHRKCVGFGGYDGMKKWSCVLG